MLGDDARSTPFGTPYGYHVGDDRPRRDAAIAGRSRSLVSDSEDPMDATLWTLARTDPAGGGNDRGTGPGRAGSR